MDAEGTLLRHSGSPSSVGIRDLGELEISGTDAHSGWSPDGRCSHGSSDKPENFKRWTRKGAETRQTVETERIILPARWGNVRFVLRRLWSERAPVLCFIDQCAGMEYIAACVCIRTRAHVSACPKLHIAIPRHTHARRETHPGQMICVVYNRVYNAQGLCRRSVCRRLSPQGSCRKTVLKERRQRGRRRGLADGRKGTSCAGGGHSGELRLHGRLSLVAWAALSLTVAIPCWAPEAGHPLGVRGAAVFPGDSAGAAGEELGLILEVSFWAAHPPVCLPPRLLSSCPKAQHIRDAVASEPSSCRTVEGRVGEKGPARGERRKLIHPLSQHTRLASTVYPNVVTC